MKQFSPLLILILTLAFSCQKIFEKPKWKTDIVAPLVKTSLGVENILKDTSFIADGDTIKFVSRQKLYDLNIDSLVKLQVKPYTKNVKLSTLTLSPQTIVDSISLGRLARGMQANGNPMGAVILGSHGSFLPIPNLDNLTAGPVDVDVNQFFEYAELITGDLLIQLENQLPLNITRLEFELSNKTLGGPATAHEVFDNLNSGTSQTRSVSLAGKTVEGSQVLNVLDMDIQGGFVQIDTNDAIILTMTISNITVQSATAIFPEQDVIDEKNETSLEGLDDVRLRQVKIEQGFVDIEAYSTAEDTIYFTYTIPSATKGGVGFVVNTVIRPAPPGGTRHESYSYTFEDYDLDLTGETGHDTVNTFYNTLRGRIKYTGKKVNLTLEDSLYVVVTMRDVKPSYIGGYLGQDTIDVGSGSVDFDIFKKIESGTLNFEKVKISLVVENGLGIDGKLQLNNIQAVNSSSGQTLNYTGVSSGIIAKATAPNSTVTTTFSLNGNETDLLNILPDKINYDVELQLNTQSFTYGVYPDFAYKGSPLNPYLDIELPLSILADQVVLSDTADFISESFKTSVNSGSFTVHVANGFPMGADLKLYFLDAGGSIIDSVITAGSILPGVLDSDKRVIGKMPSKVTFFVDEGRMQNILHARQVVFRVNFSTPNSSVPGSYVKLYSDYRMDFQLVGDFNYTIE